MRPIRFSPALAILLLVGARASITPGAQAQQSSCAGDRLDVKTLTDANVGSIDLDEVIGVNISTLAAIPPPDPLPDNSRQDPYETTVYTITGTVVEDRLQPDGDIVLALQDPNTGDTMTVNFPDAASCATGASPQFLQLMEQARTAFVQAFGMPAAGASTPLSGTAAVTGVGYLDRVQGQEDQAPNGFELYPVLQFLSSGGSGSAATPAPTSTAPPVPTAAPTP